MFVVSTASLKARDSVRIHVAYVSSSFMGRYTDEREDHKRHMRRRVDAIGRVDCMRPREEGRVCDRIYAELYDTKGCWVDNTINRM